MNKNRKTASVAMLAIVFILFGTIPVSRATTGQSFNMGTPGNWNIRFDGPANTTGPDGTQLTYGGIAVADFNQNGKADLAVSARRWEAQGRSDAGSVYIIYDSILEGVSSTGNVLDLDNPSSYTVRFDGGNTDATGLYLRAEDINNDTKPDIAFGNYQADNNGTDSGSVYLIFNSIIDQFGATTGNILDLTASSSYNVRYDGNSTDAENRMGASGVLLEDVDGDGKNDLIVANGLSVTVGTGSRIYIVYNNLLNQFGSTTGNNLVIASSTNYNVKFLPTHSTTTAGSGRDGFYVGAIHLKDVIGNSGKDLVVGSSADVVPEVGMGGVYLIDHSIFSSFGTSTTGNVVDLANPSNWSARIEGTVPFVSGNAFITGGVLSYFNAMAVDDLNGNGKADIVVAESASNNSRSRSGSTYVIYDQIFNGIAGTGNILELASTTNYNIRYDGALSNDRHVNGSQINIADLNHNGKKDLILGSAPTDIVTSTGKAYVIFDGLLDPYTSTGNILDLASTTNYNIRYDGAAAGDWLGAHAIRTLDINNDGGDDLLLGAWGADFGGANSGSLYIIYYFPHTLSLDSGFGNPSGTTYTKSGSVSAPNNPTTIEAVEWSQTGDPHGTWNDCDPTDGAFDSNSEAFTCTFSNLSTSKTFFFRAEDTKGIYTASSSYASAFFAAPPTNIIIGISGGGGGGGAIGGSGISSPTPPIVPPVPATSTGTGLGTGASSTPPLVATPIPFRFLRNLHLGDKGEDVRQLQVYLNTHGFVLTETGLGSAGQETSFFGRFTFSALVKLQEAHRDEILTPVGLRIGSGYFGERTRAWVNQNR